MKSQTLDRLNSRLQQRLEIVKITKKVIGNNKDNEVAATMKNQLVRLEAEIKDLNKKISSTKTRG